MVKSYYGGPIGTHQRSFEPYHSRPPIRHPLPQDWGFATPTQNCNHYYIRNRWSYGLKIWPMHSQCFRDRLLPLLCSSTPLFPTPTSSLRRISPCFPGIRWVVIGLRTTKREGVGLIVRAVSFQVFWPAILILQRHGRTNRQTDRRTQFLSTPYYLRNGYATNFKFWPVHSQGPSEQKPIKILEKGWESWRMLLLLLLLLFVWLYIFQQYRPKRDGHVICILSSRKSAWMHSWELLEMQIL